MVPESLMKIDDKYIFSHLPNQILRRQDKPLYYARNGAAIYITKIDVLNRAVFGVRILPYEMSKIESFDIDDEEDFKIIKQLIVNLE